MTSLPALDGTPETLQYVIDKLASAGIDTGGRKIRVRFGSATLTWPGAAAFTTTLTQAHGMGTTPVAAAAVATLPGGTAPCVVHVVALDSTNIQWRGYAADASSPAAATTKTFYWVAIG